MAQGDKKSDNKDAARDKEVSGVALLYKAFRVLDAVADSRTPPRVADLLQLTDLSKGTLYRVVQALVDRRYLRVDPNDQSYRLGTRLFDMAHAVWEGFDLRRAAASELVDLRERTGETTRLAIMDRYEALFIDQADGLHELRVNGGVGSRYPLHATAAGKAILSALEPVHLAETLARLPLSELTPATIVDGDEFRAHLSIVRARGYATSVDERVTGISSVAAPILDARKVPIGAIVVTGPSTRLTNDDLESIGRDLIAAARRIAGNAGLFSEAYSVSTAPRPPKQISDDVTCALPFKAVQGESPLWVPGQDILYWVDVLAPALHIFNPRIQHNRTIPLRFIVSAVAKISETKVLLITQNGVYALNLRNNEMTFLVDPEPETPTQRLNDAKVDRGGRLWVGSMAIDGTPGHGALYSVDSQLKVIQHVDGLTMPNGIGWSPDNKWMYFVDSVTCKIYRARFDLASGKLSERTVFMNTAPEKGRPGGLTVDSNGSIWVAMYDGWCIDRFSPDGTLEESIAVPVPRPTSCIFGGPDMDILYVTSARIRLSAERISEGPWSGSVLAIRTKRHGFPEQAFIVGKEHKMAKKREALHSLSRQATDDPSA
ncbi:Bacterial transcriptional regulator family protein [Hyphomicrobiales bacterium]|nr:Bacterial transcriptional regulator family protein [Hyphomicrobiales bacterium]CAH1691775.1 Bacterial transcriptional regulator family protein [Hyphomicrobiales bacterium]